MEIGNVGWTSGVGCVSVPPLSASRLVGPKTGFGKTLKTEDWYDSLIIFEALIKPERTQ